MKNLDEEPQVGENMNINIESNVANTELPRAEQFEVGTNELGGRVGPRVDDDSPDGRWRLFRARHIQMMSLGKSNPKTVI